MRQFEFILAGTKVEDPIDYDRFVSRIFRDEAIKGLFITYPVDLTFTGSGYKKIVDQFDSEGYCSEMTLEVNVLCEEGFKLAYQGIIFLRTLELNRTKCTAKVSVQDNTYSARVFNNKNIPVGVRAARSKNEIAISPTTQIGLMFFNTSGGAAIYDTGAGEAGFTNQGVRSGFDIIATFTHMIEFITDGEVSVKSDWYDALPVDERLAILRGKELRQGNANVDTIFTTNLEDLYGFLQVHYDLFLTYEVDGLGDRFIRIEDRSFFEKAEVFVTFDNVDDVVETIKQELLYSGVNFGGRVTVDDQDANNGNLLILDMLGFKTEEYYIEGTCNVDNTLDLSHQFVTDHNVIYDMLNNPDADFTNNDDELFVVQYSIATPSPHLTEAHPIFAPFGVGPDPFIYNRTLLNSEVITRYDLQGGVANQLGEADDRAKAVKLSSDILGTPPMVTLQEPIHYPDDFNLGFDTNNNFGDGTAQGSPVPPANCFYRIPTTGMYTFTHFIDVFINMDMQYQTFDPGSAEYLNIEFGFKRYDNGGTLLDVQSRFITKVLRNSDGTPALVNGDEVTTEQLNWVYSIQNGSKLDQKRSYARTYTKLIYAEATDKVVPFYRVTHEGDQTVGSRIYLVRVESGSYFEVENTVTSGGLFIESSEDDYYTSVLTFTKKLTQSQIETLLNNAPRAISVNGITTFVEDISINHNDTFGEFQVITNNFNKQ